MPLLPFQSPAVVHHMAALDNQVAPPNSLEAIQASLRAGAAFIEVDVNALADSDYLLVHETELEAESSGQGAVGDCSPQQARSLFIKHHDVVTQYHVPLLSDVVRLFQNSPGETRLQLDFKNVIPLPTDEPLARLVQLIAPLDNRVIVSSGADWQLRRLRKIAPWLALGFDVMLYIAWEPPNAVRDPRDYPKKIGAYGYYDDHILASKAHWSKAEYLQDRCESLLSLVPDVSVYYLEHNLIAQSLEDGFNWAEPLHQHGSKLDAWTMDVTNPTALKNASRLLEAGVDIFTSNTPLALGAFLRGDQARPSK